MKITLSPQVSVSALVVSKSGDVLTINGEVFDFSVIPDGATLPEGAIDCSFIVGDVRRMGGEIQLTFLLPIGADASEAARFPDPLVGPVDGPLELPQ